jgi:hypothetical protein
VGGPHLLLLGYYSDDARQGGKCRTLTARVNRRVGQSAERLLRSNTIAVGSLALSTRQLLCVTPVMSRRTTLLGLL